LKKNKSKAKRQPISFGIMVLENCLNIFFKISHKLGLDCWLILQSSNEAVIKKTFNETSTNEK